MLWYTVARDKDRQNKHVAQRHVRVLRTVVHNKSPPGINRCNSSACVRAAHTHVPEV